MKYTDITQLFQNKKSIQQQRLIKDSYRKIYVNHELPQDLTYQDSDIPLINYPKNKIRTTKYTPISFLPKNLFFQFTNLANSYFLFIVIIGAFEIFGVPNPALSAAPLIVIVILTLIRDGIEDYRRAIIDLDLNNSPIHLLTGLHNPNVNDHVGVWRRFKKRLTRLIFGHFQRKQLKRPRRESNELQRTSTVIDRFSTDTRHQHSLAHADLINTQLHIPDNIKFKTRNWKDVHVGDFIRIRNNEEVPADVIIISTSDLDTGNCYIETRNLDGETNLKTRKLLNCGEGIKHLHDLLSTQFWVEVEPPNTSLYSFKGVIHYGEDKTEPVTNDNVLLRGFTLRNTKWVLGFVVYTGPETKIMLNGGVTPTKKSKISSELNLSVIINFVFLFIICFLSGLINGLFYRRDDTSRLFFEYAPYVSTPAANGVVSFFVAIILYQSLVPISLYISIEIIKTVQLIFIYADVKMYYERLDFPCTPKSWSISDDLGQIEYVFSDKTGTLTQNLMEFKKCTINGKSYGNCYTEAKMGMDKREGVDIITKAEEMHKLITEETQEMCELIVENFHNDEFDREELTLISKDYVDDTLHDSEQKLSNEKFMLALALCHTVVTERDPVTDRIIFKAESPDEAALVKTARDLGFVFVERTRNGAVVQKYGGQPIEYKILATIEFTSLRKRMSIIVEVDGKPVLITKGADNVIYERLSKQSSKIVATETALQLEEFAREGLRTLCIAQRDLDPAFVSGWLHRYNEAQSSISDDRDDLIGAVTDEIEIELILLGGTAIEDRLQDMVPESIRILGDAGIKLWVLTGDKVETAINIGFSCNLLNTTMKLLVIKLFNKDEDDIEETEDSSVKVDSLLTDYLQQEFQMTGSESELTQARNEHSTPKSNCAIIIDGASLTEIFLPLNQHLQRKFLLLLKNCKSVLCCRVSPAQKALVVKLVKTELNVMTLAIGDGANDVAMIQAANVGVGIAGEEGRQLVMSSDYAIAQFRFLTRLLLVHGRWSYRRLAEMIPCFFYKNVTFTMTLFWFGIFNNFDGSYLFEFTYLTLYNLAFTSLPVIFLAILDQDVSDTVSLLVPQLYKSGILGLEWSQYKFIYYMVDGLYQSFISFFFPYFVYRMGKFVCREGLQLDHRFWIGIVVAHIAVVSNNLYVLLQMKRWDWLSLTIVSISILILFFWTGVWSLTLNSQEFYHSASQLYGSLIFWSSFFVGVLSCLLPRFIYDNIRRLYFPRDVDIIRERVLMGDYKSYPKGYDPTNFEDVKRHRELVTDTETIDVEKQEFNESSSSQKNTIELNTVLVKVQEPVRQCGNSMAQRLRALSKSMKPNFTHKPTDSDIDSIRNRMISKGQLGRNSLERVQTTHQVDGVVLADSLLERYSTRGSGK